MPLTGGGEGWSTRDAHRDARAEGEQVESRAQVVVTFGILLAVVLLGVLGSLLDLAGRELIQKGQQLEDAVAFQKHVMGIIGHDVRSPLAAILRIHLPREPPGAVPPAPGAEEPAPGP